MASTSENRSYRPFFIIVLPLMLVITIGGIIFAISIGYWYQAAPLVIVAMALLKPIQWTMYWQCSPTEKAVLAKHLEKQPVLNLWKAWLAKGKVDDDKEEPDDEEE